MTLSGWPEDIEEIGAERGTAREREEIWTGRRRGSNMREEGMRKHRE